MNASDIKQSVSPADFYAYQLPDMKQTTRRAWANGSLCPFHADKSAGSFYVNLETGAYRCFSCGASGGDILAFLMERDGLTFPEAINQIKQEWSL